MTGVKKRIISVICILTAVVLTLCSCNGTSKPESGEEAPVYEDKAEQKIVKITLPYTDADTLNPFMATDEKNLALTYLYCQPLFEVKSDYSVEPIIAESYETEGRNIYVMLKPVTFSDGSLLTPRDVVYSYELAREAPAFRERLKNVEDAYMRGERVAFTLTSPDILGVNALCFPVVKFGSAWSSDVLPIGSGMFVKTSDNAFTLNPNSEIISEINTVELYDVKKPEYLTNELEIGNYNFLFDDFSEGSYKRIVAQNKAITLNNLVYLGLNSKDAVLSSSAMRTAIYYAIDKEEVSATAYQGYSKATSVPFNPELYLLKDAVVPEIAGDKQKCASILSKLGYNFRDEKSVLNNTVNSLNLKLLVNSDNAFRVSAAYRIATELNSQGFNITVDTVDFATYSQRIAAGDYQMYIGEVKLTENMDMSVFRSGSASAGMDTSASFFADYDGFKAGETELDRLIDSFLDSMPFVPICYRMGLAAYSRAYTPDFSYAPFNIYGNIENWEAAE